MWHLPAASFVFSRFRGYSRGVAVACLTLLLADPHAAAGAGLPRRLSDADYWRLIATLSETAGSFRSDNYISNERGFQLVIPDLVAHAGPGRVYVGVGPEQNFSYVLAVRPRMAFVVDIRRGNLLEHLLYKALFELSTDRVKFLSRLFSRVQPDSVNGRSSVPELFAALQRAEPRADLYEKNAKAVVDKLTVAHRFALDQDDVQAIRNIYRAFFIAGPNIDYGAGGGDGGGAAPTYQDLMTSDDGRGVNRSYLASEQAFAAVRTLQLNNLIVPVVGDFAGPSALRAIGDYVRKHGSRVSAFYVSNVEEYLTQDNRWDVFCSSVSTLPLDRASTFIFTGPGAPPVAGVRPLAGLDTHLRPMLDDGARCPPSQAPAGKP